MRRRELPLVLLALVVCQAPREQAAPASAGGGTLLAKMYPRGNHWAVGHLMGKKSMGETPYVYEGRNLREDLRWEEAARNLLGLMEAEENRSGQPPQRQPRGNRQPTWDSEDGSKFKDVGSKEEGSHREGKHPQLNGR
ncbi:gastrin-releasing peptide isoform X3 [Choloepus didactylus]|uniref:gastrin-releasing peptide isoform X3 n=1 Tax=Choloepus didactylus TaxID=27675 RepID=UPI0018A08EBD|nr:gastrin-releasing peptide isoform X3 [Choloepus didactylus]